MKKYLISLALLPGLLYGAAIESNWKAGSGSWSTPANWNPTNVPGANPGDIADLKNQATSASPTISLDAIETLGTMNLDLGTPYTVANAGRTLTFDTGSATTSANINITSSNGSANHAVQCPIQLNSPLIINQGLTSAFTFTIGSGIISQAVGTNQSLTINGPGTVSLQGANSYSGGTTVNTAMVIISNDNNLGTTGACTLNNATLQLSASVTSSRSFTITGTSSFDLVGSGVTSTLTGVISGGGSLTKTDAGTLVLSGSNTYSGGTTVTTGVLKIATDSNLGNSSGSLNLNGGALQITQNMSSSRSGNLSSGTLATDQTVTLTGNFTIGNSATTFNIDGVSLGGGTVILTPANGTNSYAGGITIGASFPTTLQTNTNGLQGNTAISSGSSLNFSQIFTGTYPGILSGSGTLSLTGTGNITFTGNSSGFTGQTNVNQGTLTMNGSLSSSTVTVASGAKLRGTGTVQSVIGNAGSIIYPGSSPGTLTILNTLTLSSTSNVSIDLSPTAASKLAVGGTATLNGAGLTINPVAGFYAPITCYTILTSGNLVGSFAAPTSTSANFTPALSTSGTTVTLCIQPVNLFFNFPFANSNAASVGNNINALNRAGEISDPNPTLNSIFNQFLGQSNAAINAALDQMHPAPYSAFSELEEEIGAQLASLFHRKPFLFCNCDRSNRFWVEGYTNTLKEKNHGIQLGFSAASHALALGYDWKAVSSDFVIGLGGAWNKSDLKWHFKRGAGESNGFYGAGYFDWKVWNFYFSGALLGGADFYETDRHIQFLSTNAHAKANFRALDFTGQLSMAYFFGNPAAYFYPYANFDWLYTHFPSFNEKGASGLDLNINKRTASTIRSEVGLAFQIIDKNASDTMCIAPLVSLGFVNMSPLERQAFESKFEGTTIPFTTHGWDQTWNLFALDFGLAITYFCYTLDLEYKVELSPDAHTLLFNQHGNFRFDWKW